MLSIVIPIYNEEKNIPILYRELKSVLNKYQYEIIFVDDGSRDRSFDVLHNIQSRDKKVKVIKLRRNFGQTASFDAGFKNAKGRIIITMDADLQNDPKDITRLLSKMEEGYDVVSGWRYRRRDSFQKKVFSMFANFLRRLLTKETTHDSGCSLKAYKKECLEDLDLYGEMHRFVPAILSWRGYKIGEVKVNHRARVHGKTKYGLKRLIKGFLDLIIIKFWMQYSARPIHLFGGAGLLSFALGLLIGIYLITIKIMYGVLLADRPLLLFCVLLIILGALLVLFGILADIMIKIYYKDKQIYSIQTKYKSK